MSDSRLLTVSELTEYISRAIQGDPRLSDVTVTGELSNFVHHSSGHMYFTLKDRDCSIKGVMFQIRNRRLPFQPENGQHVYVRGDVNVYKRGGNYQLNAYAMEPVGQGALALAFSQLKAKLAQEGLFDQGLKRPLPQYPTRIGVVTSPQAAALQDFLVTAAEQGWPLTIELAPAIVQGERGAASVVAALKLLYRRPVDVIVITRGGGSLEELWVFNEEAVARAVAAAPMPVVSAIGHEIDFTICDFVADWRAATPTAAARLVVPDARSFAAALRRQLQRLASLTARLAEARRRQLTHLASRPVLARPLQLLLPARQNLDLGSMRLTNAFTALLGQRRQLLERVGARLGDLNPLAVLGRGFALVQAETGVINSVRQLKPGQPVNLLLRDGQARATITTVEGDGNSGKTCAEI